MWKSVIKCLKFVPKWEYSISTALIVGPPYYLSFYVNKIYNKKSESVARPTAISYPKLCNFLTRNNFRKHSLVDKYYRFNTCFPQEVEFSSNIKKLIILIMFFLYIISKEKVLSFVCLSNWMVRCRPQYIYFMYRTKFGKMSGFESDP